MDDVNRSRAIATFALQFSSLVERIYNYERVIKQGGEHTFAIVRIGDDDTHKYTITLDTIERLKYAAFDRCYMLIKLGAKDVVRSILARYEQQ